MWAFCSRMEKDGNLQSDIQMTTKRESARTMLCGKQEGVKTKYTIQRSDNESMNERMNGGIMNEWTKELKTEAENWSGVAAFGPLELGNRPSPDWLWNVARGIQTRPTTQSIRTQPPSPWSTTASSSSEVDTRPGFQSLNITAVPHAARSLPRRRRHLTISLSAAISLPRHYLFPLVPLDIHDTSIDRHFQPTPISL